MTAVNPMQPITDVARLGLRFETLRLRAVYVCCDTFSQCIEDGMFGYRDDVVMEIVPPFNGPWNFCPWCGCPWTNPPD